MTTDPHCPPEALLLALAAEVGLAARDLLAASGYPLGGAEGGPAGTPGRIAWLARHLEQHGHSTPQGTQVRPALPTRRDGVAPAGRPRRGPHAAQAARALLDYWAGRPPSRVLSRYGENVDPSTATGRWQLLCLAILLGAPVPWARVEETFSALRRDGLLDLEDVAAATGSWQQAVDGVLERLYRGPVRRKLARERLTAGARVVRARWRGDPGAIHEEARGQIETIVALMREHLPGIDRIASWFVREMGRLGIWPRAHLHAAAFYPDPYLRKAAANLGMAAADESPAALRAMVDALFDGDSTVLSSHGRELCASRSLGVCLSRCPVSRYCRAWTTWRDTGQEAGGRSADP